MTFCSPRAASTHRGRLCCLSQVLWLCSWLGASCTCAGSCPCPWLACMSRNGLITIMIVSPPMWRTSLTGPRMAGFCASHTATTWASGWACQQQSFGSNAHPARLFRLGESTMRDGIVPSHSLNEVGSSPYMSPQLVSNIVCSAGTDVWWSLNSSASSVQVALSCV